MTYDPATTRTTFHHYSADKYCTNILHDFTYTGNLNYVILRGNKKNNSYVTMVKAPL